MIPQLISMGYRQYDGNIFLKTEDGIDLIITLGHAHIALAGSFSLDGTDDPIIADLMVYRIPFSQCHTLPDLEVLVLEAMKVFKERPL